MTNAPGGVLLLVSSILYIIFNVVTLFNTPITLITIDIWLWEFGGEAMREAWTIIYAADIVIALVAILVGVLGVVFCSKAHNAVLLIGLMIFSMILAIIYNFVYTAAIIGFSFELMATEWLRLFIGLALSILFIVGASKNKKAADAAPYEKEWR